MFFVFPEGGFSIAEDLCKLPADFRPPFVAAEVGRLAAELGREDCNKSYQTIQLPCYQEKSDLAPNIKKTQLTITLLICNEYTNSNVQQSLEVLRVFCFLCNQAWNFLYSGEE